MKTKGLEVVIMKLLRRWAVLLCVLTAVWAGTGCAKEVDSEAVERTELVLWYYWDQPKNQRYLADLLDGFNTSQDRITVRARYIPVEHFKKRLALSVADGAMPDIALVDSSDFKYYHDMGHFADLTDEIPELQDYLPIAKVPCTVGDRIYGMPFGLNCVMLYYNETLLREAGCGPPSDWHEFYDAAVKLTRGHVDGFAISALQTEGSVYGFLPMLWSMGGSMNAIDSPESRQAFKLLSNLEQQGVLSKQCINLSLSDLTEQFGEGNIAMMLNSSGAVDILRETHPELEFDVAPVPSGNTSVTVIGGEIFGVTSGATQKEAIEFLRYLADKERMAEYIDGFGFLAPREDVCRLQFPDDPQKQKLIDYIKTARVREFSREWPQLSLVVSDAVSKVIIGEQPEEEILKEAAEEMQKIREGR